MSKRQHKERGKRQHKEVSAKKSHETDDMYDKDVEDCCCCCIENPVKIESFQIGNFALFIQRPSRKSSVGNIQYARHTSDVVDSVYETLVLHAQELEILIVLSCLGTIKFFVMALVSIAASMIECALTILKLVGLWTGDPYLPRLLTKKTRRH